MHITQFLCIIQKYFISLCIGANEVHNNDFTRKKNYFLNVPSVCASFPLDAPVKTKLLQMSQIFFTQNTNVNILYVIIQDLGSAPL